MINAHAHLDFPALTPIADNAIAIVPSVGRQNWDLVQLYPYFALGIHPWVADEHTVADLARLQYLVKCSQPIALGECGLDFARDTNRRWQLQLFDAQIKLALDYDLPLIIHAVRATENVILRLKKYRKARGTIHAFSGSQSQAETLIKLGFYLGFGLNLSARVQQIAQNMPLERILIETDDHPDPNALISVAKTLANLRNIPVETLIAQCDANAIELFGLQ